MSPPAGLPSRTASRAVKIPHEAANVRPPTATGRRRSTRHLKKQNSIDMTDSARSSISFDSGQSLSSSPEGRDQARASSSASPSSNPSRRPPSIHFSSQESAQSDAPSYTSKEKGKAIASDVDNLPPPNTLPLLCPPRTSNLGPMMLSNQTYKSVNLRGPDSDEPPRLITYTKSAQGFTWNEELFLPSYMVSRYSRGRRKQYDGDMGDDDVSIAEVYVTDDDIRRYMG